MSGFSKYLLYLLLPFLLSSNAFALIEVGGEYSYSRRVYGVDRESDIVSRTSGGSIAVFLLNFLALELNYSKAKQKRNEFPNITSEGSTLTLTQFQNTVVSESWGAGVRFSLAPRNALLRPDVSIGYANQAITDSSLYTFFDSSSSSTITTPGTTTRYKSDSIFGSFALNFRLTQRLKLKAGIKTIFPAFEWNQAKDYLKYSIGFTWLL